MKFKKTILIDLDGVFNTYTGKYDDGFISPIKDGAKEFLVELSRDYKIKLFTTRDKYLVQDWINENSLDEFVFGVTNMKELCFLYIDDRCICFNGDYSSLMSEISNFKAWYKL